MSVKNNSRAEVKLRQTEEKIQRLMENLPGIAYSCRIDSAWTMLFLSKGCKSVTGYDPEELIGNQVLSYGDLIYSDDYSKVLETITEAVETGSFFQIEYRIVTKTGKVRWVWEKGHPVYDEEFGEKILEGFISDITDRVVSEQKTKDAKNKYETLLNHLQTGVFYINRDGEIKETNVALIKLLGSPSVEETRKINIFEFQPLIDFGYTGKLEECINSGKVVYGEGEYLSKWGRKSYFKYYFAPIKKDGMVEGVLASIEDVSRRKRIEEELLRIQKIESIGTLAGGIAHDFNNLLTSIFGYITFAKMDLPDDHKALTKLEQAENAMDRAVSLTRQLLTFSKGGEPFKEILEIEDIVKETVSFDLSGSNVRPEIVKVSNLKLVKADKGQLYQVFSNLVINAKQAMPDGGILRIFLENVNVEDDEIAGLKEGEYVKIKFEDEGVGIEKKYIERIFYPYFTTKQSGSGLGLAVVFSIIKKHGGYIHVTSEPGVGSCFSVYLPSLDKPISESEADKKPGDDISDRNLRVLVMDDEEPILDLIKDLLESTGCFVKTVTDGNEAVREYQEAMQTGMNFDVVIMDLTIPGGMGGKEAVGQIIDMDSNARCIVSSGYASDSVMAEYKKYGFLAAVKKPFKISEFLKIINEVTGSAVNLHTDNNASP